MNNPDDEAYDAAESTRVRRDADPGRQAPSRPGAPVGPPPPADWFKPASERGAQAPATPADTPAAHSRPGQSTGGPGSTGYTSQPGIPVERYPTPRPGDFPATARPGRRGGAARPTVAKQRPDEPAPGGDRPTQRIGRVEGAPRGAAPSAGQPTQNISYGRDRSAQLPPTRPEDDPAYGAESPARDPYDRGPGTGGHPVSHGGDYYEAPGGGPSGPPSGAVDVAAAGKRKRRRWPTITAIVVVVLVLLLVGADRLAHHIAVGQMRKQVAVSLEQNLQPGQAQPTIRHVSIGGFPFLTQILFGKFTDIGVGIDNIPTTETGPKISSVDAHLKGVHVDIGAAIGNKLKDVPVDNVEATVKITYAELNAFLKTQPGAFQVEPVAGGKEVRVTGQSTVDLTQVPGVEIPGLGNLSLGSLGLSNFDITFGGTAKFAVENNRVVLTPVGLTVETKLPNGAGGGGTIPLPPGLNSPIAMTLPDLPFDLVIVSAGTTDTGLTVAATAKDVVLPAQPPAKK